MALLDSVDTAVLYAPGPGTTFLFLRACLLFIEYDALFFSIIALSWMYAFGAGVPFFNFSSCRPERLFLAECSPNFIVSSGLYAPGPGTLFLDLGMIF